VSAFGVVEAAEGVEQGLHVGQCGRAWAWSKPAFEGLVEAFDFSLGLGVAGVAVLLDDSQVGQQ